MFSIHVDQHVVMVRFARYAEKRGPRPPADDDRQTIVGLLEVRMDVAAEELFHLPGFEDRRELVVRVDSGNLGGGSCGGIRITGRHVAGSEDMGIAFFLCRRQVRLDPRLFLRVETQPLSAVVYKDEMTALVVECAVRRAQVRRIVLSHGCRRNVVVPRNAVIGDSGRVDVVEEALKLRRGAAPSLVTRDDQEVNGLRRLEYPIEDLVVILRVAAHDELEMFGSCGR